MADLSRFLSAQAKNFQDAADELKAGRKQTHWMWYVFPQMRGLGRSETARFYGIENMDEARAYLKHDVLGPRLIQVTELTLLHPDRTVYQIFSSPDDMKFVSSMTLFEAASGQPESIFGKALDIFNEGRRDAATLALL